VLGLVTAVAWGTAARERRERERLVSHQMERARQSIARARGTAAELERRRAAALAVFDRGQLVEAERDWARVEELEAALEASWAAASRAVEAATAIDARREPVRRLGAAVIHARALEAERRRDRVALDDLLSRLALYDVRGRYRRRWSAASAILVRAPAGTVVRIATVDPGAARRVGPARALAASRRASMPPGTYLLDLETPGRPGVRVPVRLARGRALEVDLDPPARVPDGMIWIPAGRFSFGTGADGVVRRHGNTVPLHEVATGAYWIARHEVTYGEWIRFLDALPAAERAERTPVSGAGALQGGVSLARQPDGRWRLVLQPTNEAYSAVEGEPIRYPHRRRAALQDWSKIPVGGLRVEDVLAYTGWLDRSGVLPGARPCTEHEWERAARGADDRTYPHGDILDPADANIDATYGRDPATMGPDAVGSHPESRSPHGLDDMAGNLLEWTRSSLVRGEWVLRGGGFYYSASAAWIGAREPTEPSIRDGLIGLRVCADAP
jgi:formylglycine-generating enzyme required for sulfatase activity